MTTEKQAEQDALKDFEDELGQVPDVEVDEEDLDREQAKQHTASKPKPAPKPKPAKSEEDTEEKPAKSERVQYDRKNTMGKVIVILKDNFAEGRKDSYRTRFSWPSLQNGMSVTDWHVATKAAAQAEIGVAGEGIPNIFLTELVANDFIKFVDEEELTTA